VPPLPPLDIPPLPLDVPPLPPLDIPPLPLPPLELPPLPLPPLELPPLPLPPLELPPLPAPPVIRGYAQRYVGPIMPPPLTSMHISPCGHDVSVGLWHEIRQFPDAPPAVVPPLPVPPPPIMPPPVAT
jgi:hypothetical protein